jgi:hypothetical protein
MLVHYTIEALVGPEPGIEPGAVWSKHTMLPLQHSSRLVTKASTEDKPYEAAAASGAGGRVLVFERHVQL